MLLLLLPVYFVVVVFAINYNGLLVVVFAGFIITIIMSSLSKLPLVFLLLSTMMTVILSTAVL